MTEDDVIGFIREHIGSVYALEVLLVMKRGPAKEWPTADLVRELRSSRTAVNEALNRLRQAGLVAENSAGRCSFSPATSDREQMAEAIDQLYSSKPISVVKAIMSAPDHKLRAFSDAFKLKE